MRDTPRLAETVSAGGSDLPDDAHSRRALPALMLVVVVAALVVGALLGGVTTALATRPPSDTSVDAGFSRDMQTHHAQAVEMALLVRDRSDDEQLRAVAYDIATSQQQQMGQMYGWLVQWGLPQTGQEPPMAWMRRDGHDMGGAEQPGRDSAGMPGMATAAQLGQLESTDGLAAERLFLELMIAHHRGGIEMADAARSRAGTDEVRALAAAVSTSQESETELLTSLLDSRR
ncbi:MAG: DUF305 domain-containing protein [Dermatophilaceae bacterium]